MHVWCCDITYGFGTFLGSPEKMNSSDDTVIYNQNQDPNQQQTTTNSDSMTDFEKSKGNIHLHN